MNDINVYRYPGSRAFEDTHIDRRLFFGRDEEKLSVLHMVLTKKLIVLFAKSGIGKTSLLNAGLMKPLREQNYLPIRVTFTDPEIEPLETIYNKIDQIIKEYQLNSKQGEKDTLWQYFKTAQFWRQKDPLTPVILLDQFEELFTLHSRKSREKFFVQLADLVRNRIPIKLLESIKPGEKFSYTDAPPEIKIIISIREDFLAHLEEISSEIPDILHNRFRLLRLSLKNALKAIKEPAKIKDKQIETSTFRYNPYAIKTMLGFLSKKTIKVGTYEKVKDESSTPKKYPFYNDFIKNMFDFLSSTANRIKTLSRFLKIKKEEIQRISTNEVEPFELQILCQHIERKFITAERVTEGKGDVEINETDLGGLDGMKQVLEEFYNNQIKEISSPFMRRRLRKLIEKSLICPYTNRRLSLDVEFIYHKTKVPKTILEKLVDTRLMRSEHRMNSVYFELSHDTLIEPIRKSQKKRKRNKLLVGASTFILVFIFITNYLVYMEQQKKYDDYVSFSKKANKLETVIESLDNAIKIKPKDSSLYYLKGNAYEDNGNLEEAKKNYEEAIKLNPKFATALVKLGTVNIKLGNLDNARKNYEKAIEVNKNFKEAYKELAFLDIKLNQHELAIETYIKAIDANQEFGNLYIELRKALESKGQNEYVSKIFEIASKVETISPEYYYNLGSYWYEQGENEKAANYYARALKNDPDYTPAFYGLGNVFFEKKDFEEAKKNYEKALNKDPNYAPAFYGLGNVFFKKKDNKEAIKLYGKAIEVNKNFKEAYKELALLYIELNQYELAIETYKKAINANKEFGNLYIELGKALESKGQNDYVSKIFEIASKVETISPEYYYNLGSYWYEKGENGKAIDCYKKTANLDSNYAPAYCGLGNVFFNLKVNEKAIDYYERALEKNTDYAPAYCGLGNVFFNQKNDEEAIKHYQKALNKDPNHAPAFFGLGKVFFEQKNDEEAIKHYQKALNKDPNYAPAYCGLGNVFFNQKNDEEAIFKYKRALEIDSNYVPAYIALGTTYFKLKNDYNRGYDYFIKAQGFRLDDKTIDEKLAEACLVTERFNDAYNLSEKVLTYKNLGLDYKLSMEFVSSCSLLFMGKEIKAYEKINNIVEKYKSLPKEYKSTYDYKCFKLFLTETNKLKEDDKNTLLDVVEALSLPRKEADQKILDLNNLIRLRRNI